MRPTSHLLLIFPPEPKVSTTENIDRLVLIELPLPKNAPLFEMVTKCTDHAAKNTPTHPTWSTMYARNVINELSPRRQHKAKTVTLFTIDKTMVERFERLQMALRTITDGWCPTTPTLPRCVMHVLMLRSLLVFKM